MSKNRACSVCGGELSSEAISEGLCLACLAGLAIGDGNASVRAGTATEATAALSSGGSGGSIRGGRYRILARLGHGGMGEVWLATDLKLGVEVALKALKPELLSDGQALETLRQEVRAAREVVSPNVCRVYDLIEVDGQELVSMEYIDGVTLAERLAVKGPLDLAAAHEVAGQLLAGLEAIHAAGLVHRDVKPENIMVTRSGRVVLMDFGIARSVAESATGTLSGTRVYMAPEQARGDPPSAVSDVFSAGIVLAEMVAPGGLDSREARQAVWTGVHRHPPEVADTPWAPVILRAVDFEPGRRFPGAAAMARALEEVTLRIDRGEDSAPYPGLASFSAEQAEFFFGRELEVEEVWKRLRSTHLLGIIGPSGAGKSSFVRAGILPVVPEGWRAVVAAPETAPLASLARALVSELSGDSGSLQLLVGVEDAGLLLEVVRRWRSCHDEVLVVLDQFEELFTLNSKEVEEGFSRLVADLVLEADAHVLVAMRDDFLSHCAARPALAPLFSGLVPLRPLAGAALRRALVQPALGCGYRFEDETLVDEMLAEVREERGALPLLAFAASRLWEHRDSQRGLLTRAAYEHVGGVSGALARHAEHTLAAAGEESVPVVRELFRNLVTAQGTRVARTHDDLLSVFDDQDRATAEQVLGALVDARLLTSYEVAGGGPEEPAERRVEIVHESLLSNWPRLVRWQVQDQEGALLRDQLRQAARLWEERGRPDDLLWTGTSYREFALWRERYEGGLSEAEEWFTRAMRVHAERRRRTRRRIRAVVFAGLLLGLGIIGGLWRQAVAARAQTERQSLRAQANELLALGRLELESDPTGALAYALASLERADQPAARLFALETLWRGPIARVLEGTVTRRSSAQSVDFSPDGRWIAEGTSDGKLELWPRGGGEPRVLDIGDDGVVDVRFSARPGLLVTRTWPSHILQVWSVPEGRLVRRLPIAGPLDFRLAGNPEQVLVFRRDGDRTVVEAWPLETGGPRLLAELGPGLSEWSAYTGSWDLGVDAQGTRLAYAPISVNTVGSYDVGDVELVSLSGALHDPPRAVGHHGRWVAAMAFHPDGRHVASVDDTGEVRIWSLDEGPGAPTRTLHQPAGLARFLRFDSTASRLAATSFAGHTALWNLEGPPDASPQILWRGLRGAGDAAFGPHGDWVVTQQSGGVQIWPVEGPVPMFLEGHEKRVREVAFLPDGRWIASTANDGTLRLWPLFAGGTSRILFDDGDDWLDKMAVGPAGRRILVSSSRGAVWVVPVGGGPVRKLDDLVGWSFLALGSRYAAARWGRPPRWRFTIRVWDLETGGVQDFDGGDEPSMIAMAPGDRLVWGGRQGIRVRDLASGEVQVLSTRACGWLHLSQNGRFLLAGDQGPRGEAVRYDLEGGTPVTLTSHGPSLGGLLDATGTVALTAPLDLGPLRVGRVGSERVHLIVTEGEDIDGLTLSPDGRWVATYNGAGKHTDVIHLWPVPELSRPPLHSLPHDQLLARLRSFTNLRVVADPSTATGWGWRLDPFPGWEEAPAW